MAENEDYWHKMLSEGNALLDGGRTVLGWIPSDSRCMFCHGPFEGFGGKVMSLVGKGQAREDPRVCNSCVKQGQRHPGGAHVDLATVFADMRGSTPTAERIGDRAFSALIDRFFKVSSKVLIEEGAIVGRLAGDQAIGYFVPGFAGKDYARAAMDAAVELLRVTGHGDEGGPWIPLGVGVHAGNAYVGVLNSDSGAIERTALGDAVNVGARLADSAGVGEILASIPVLSMSGIDTDGLERRSLQLKGKTEPFEVAVIRPA